MVIVAGTLQGVDTPVPDILKSDDLERFRRALLPGRGLGGGFLHGAAIAQDRTLAVVVGASAGPGGITKPLIWVSSPLLR
jgi:hypothetical protein